MSMSDPYPPLVPGPGERTFVKTNHAVPVSFSSSLQNKDGFGDEVGEGSCSRKSLQQCTRVKDRRLDIQSSNASRSGLKERDGMAKGMYHVLEILWDFVQAFDKVDRGRVWREGLRLGCPMVLLRLSMESYTWSRTVTTEGGLATEWMQAVCGVVLGSAFVVYELNCSNTSRK